MYPNNTKIDPNNTNVSNNTKIDQYYKILPMRYMNLQQAFYIIEKN